MVAVGTFVLVNGEVCRTLKVENSKSVECNRFVALDRSGLNKRPISQHYKEIVQSDDTISIKTDDIEDIVFVFHREQLKEWMVGHGSHASYFVRFQFDGQEIPAESFVCFPDLSPEYHFSDRSYALEAFQTLGRMADASATILTRAAESQGRSGSAPLRHRG